MRAFALGQVVMTAGVIQKVDNDPDFAAFILSCMVRYKKNDWGTLDKEDKAENDRALVLGNRLLAAYIYPADNTKIWIITEWDRSVTTILFPSEY